MKKCSFCAEEIQDEAIKCRHCFEFLDGRKQQVEEKGILPKNRLPWYFSTSFMVLTFITVPPFVLPSVWLHPRMHWLFKVLITLVVIGFCWVSYIAMNGFMHQFDEAIKMWDQSPI